LETELIPSLSRRAVLAGALGAAAWGRTHGAFAQGASGWPNKPVRLIVPFAAGGGTDAFARPLAKVLSGALGQSFVIDNRGGAGGTLGADVASKSPADGYTFLVGAVHHTIAVSLYPKLGYDLQKDLLPVTVLTYVPNVVVVNPARMDVKNWAEFHQAIQKNPGKYNYGSAGNGTTHHLTVELYKTLTRGFATHIPYRGAGPAMQDLLAGQVDFMFDGLGTALPQIRAGKLRALALTSSKRSAALPDVPTLGEVGIKGYDARTWYALWAPPGTPADLINKLQQATRTALEGDELKKVWESYGAEAGGQSPAEMKQFVNSEIQKWAKVVKDSGARLD
jgi:tripartite-type tricarboxylate transporter receptor subunit TctC